MPCWLSGRDTVVGGGSGSNQATTSEINQAYHVRVASSTPPLVLLNHSLHPLSRVCLTLACRIPRGKGGPS